MYNRQLICFVTIAECGSFTKAARRLYVSASALSQQLRSLEQHLGLRLFERDNRHVRLTRAGESLYRDAKEIMRLSDEALRRALALAGVEKEALQVGFGGSESNRLLPALSAAYLKEHPQERLIFQRLPFRDMADALLSGMLDVAVMPQALLQKRSALQCFPLLSGREYCVLSKTHPLAGRECIRFEDLQGYRMVLPDLPCKSLMALRERMAAYPEIGLEITPLGETSSILVRTGNCVIIQTSFNCPREADLACIPLEGDYRSSVELIACKDASQAVRDFIRIAQGAVEGGEGLL